MFEDALFHEPSMPKGLLSPKPTESIDLLSHPLTGEVMPWFRGDHAISYSYTQNM